MSGILALAAAPGRAVDPELLERMTESMRFRGPDGIGVRAVGRVGLGHALLAVETDPTPQPRSLDGRTWMVGDVRLDGRGDLIAALEREGAVLSPETSDCDLLLHAYRAWDTDCRDHLLGDFAFAVWDAAEERLFCARDQLGVRPLYYARIPSGLAVSNTLQTLLRHPEVGDELDDLAIADFLLFIYKQDPESTSFRDVRRLPPGHRLIWREGNPDVRAYWSVGPIEPLELPRPEDYVERYRELLRTAVADRTRVDRLHVLMSGGLDSTSVTALARQLGSETGRPAAIDATTIVYDHLLPDEERHYAGIAARHLGIPIRFVAADGYDLFQDLDELPRAPEPNANPFWALEPALYDQWRGKVALYGMGPDDLLRRPDGHMTRLLRAGRLLRVSGELLAFVRLHRRLPRVGLRRQIVRRLTRSRETGLYRYRVPPWLSPDLVSRLELADRVSSLNAFPPIPSGPRPWATRLLSNPQLATQIFETSDPGWSSVPVQFRYPHLDLRVARFLASVPFAEWQRGKGLLRLAIRDTLPSSILSRPKTALRGDPLAALIERHNPFSSWRPAGELERYVDLERFDPSGTMDLRDGLDMQLWLHVFALSEWLTGEPQRRKP